ncbi:MAG: MBL fold metallo-hydrolase [Deltaproteobacteria bacterium SG8_13]|nr:MAG: MBL fold metallo-hydrolase [Deltaproteobacteria bacterium SG8_13]
MEIIENLWQVGGDGLTAPGDAAVYLVRFAEQAALIDAGCGPAHRQLVDNIGLCLPPGVQISHLLLTHCHYDHTGGAEAVRNQFGCRIVAHEQDAVFLENGDSEVTAASWYGSRMKPLMIDRKIAGTSETIPIGSGRLQALHCPGHSPGSLVFTAVLTGNTVLFGQDVHGPLHPSLLSDRSAYRRSLQRMLELDADILCEGHFGVVRGKKAVRRFIQSYLKD